MATVLHEVNEDIQFYHMTLLLFTGIKSYHKSRLTQVWLLVSNIMTPPLTISRFQVNLIQGNKTA